MMQNRPNGEGTALPVHLKPLFSCNQTMFQDRRIKASFRGVDAIFKAFPDSRQRRSVTIDRHPAAIENEQAAQIINPMHMIGMTMGIQNAIKLLDVGTEQLRA